MLVKNLFEEILIKPAREFNQLKIIAGYASPAMANKHLTNIAGNIFIDLIIGMAPADGVGKGSHIGFQQLNRSGRFSCNYVITPPPVHIKSYIWLRNGIPGLAFTGSGNYSQNAFMEGAGTVESFAVDDPFACNALFQSIKSNSKNCLDADIGTNVNFYDELYKRNQRVRSLGYAHAEAPVQEKYADCYELTLLSSRSGEIHNQSGLNWGQRKGREPNQAYIPVPAEIARSGFFPHRARHFTMITDDGQSFDCAIAQDGDKAIHSTENNSILGRYFRQRIGVPLGSFVTRENLENYGRTNVRICKIDDETYFMDFSVD